MCLFVNDRVGQKTNLYMCCVNLMKFMYRIFLSPILNYMEILCAYKCLMFATDVARRSY